AATASLPRASRRRSTASRPLWRTRSSPERRRWTWRCAADGCSVWTSTASIRSKRRTEWRYSRSTSSPTSPPSPAPPAQSRTTFSPGPRPGRSCRWEPGPDPGPIPPRSRSDPRPAPLQRAVVFGAGKMACGLLGYILRQSGCEVLFVARRRDVVDAINRRAGYRLTLLGKRAERHAIRGCRACSIDDAAEVVDQVARADVVMTGIGIDHLGAVAPLIAQGLWRRSQMAGARPLNVIACENLPGAGAYLRHQIVSAADVGQAMAVNAVGGFAAALTRRIMTGGALEHGELSFT